MSVYKLLLVDDNIQSLKLLKAIYDSEGYATVTANDGQQAIDILLTDKIDLIVTDVLMPNIDGYYLCYKVRTDEKLKNIPIIIYTATYTSQSEEKIALEMGADAFIRKPAVSKALLSAVREVLANPKDRIQQVLRSAESFEMMHKYSSELVTKLEQRNIELEQTTNDLQKAERNYRELNQELERKVIERTVQLENLNNELESFSYSISHDLRAPLRLQIGYSKILEEDYQEKLDKEGKRVLGTVLLNALKMNDLIDDLLEFSKLGKRELTKSEVDTEKLIENILNEINDSSPHKASVIVNDLLPVNADQALLSQVWINLISNALKFSSKKELPRIEIGSYKEKNEIVFYIKDNGSGFDMQYANKLFGVFQRLHTSDEFEGTGVGLSIIQRIVVKHGGRVWAEGETNEGATFYFSLPPGNE